MENVVGWRTIRQHSFVDIAIVPFDTSFWDPTAFWTRPPILTPVTSMFAVRVYPDVVEKMKLLHGNTSTASYRLPGARGAQGYA